MGAGHVAGGAARRVLHGDRADRWHVAVPAAHAARSRDSRDRPESGCSAPLRRRTAASVRSDVRDRHRAGGCGGRLVWHGVADQPLYRGHADRQVLCYCHHRRARQSAGCHRRRAFPGYRGVAHHAVRRPHLRRRGQLRHTGAGIDCAAYRPAGENGMKAWQKGSLVVALLVLVGVPWYGSDVLVQFGISTLLLAVLAQGWNIIGGYTGYASFGNSVFYGLGSYGVAIAMVQWHLPFGVGMEFGVVLAVVFAVLLGIPVLRLKGHYFAIATLALSQVMAAIVSNIPLAGQNIGLVLPPLNNDRLFYELSLGLLVVATLTIFWLTRSRFGFGLIAIRENEEGAAVMGVNTTLYKVMAFALSGIFSALAGGIHAYWITFL